METAVISEEIAKSGALAQLIDWFLRDIEFRETLDIVVAKGIPAKRFFILMVSASPLLPMKSRGL